MTDATTARARGIDAPLVLLGPQRYQPTVDRALDDLAVDGPVAVVTAGWQEREAEIEELSEHVGRKVINLELFRRVEAIFEEDTELFTALRERTQRLRRLQRLYGLRLGHAMNAAREMLGRRDIDDLVMLQFDGAVRAVRALDREHLEHATAIQESFEGEHGLASRESVMRQREEVARLVDGCAALAIAGGHVAVLVNRLRLLDAVGAAGDRPIVAWSAGAMALAQRIVLFHDAPPQGPGNAEVLRRGLGLYCDVQPLPHAKRRLQLDDPVRVSLFARRFGPDRCVAFDDGARLDWRDGRWTARDGLSCLTETGPVVRKFAL